jgi:hypothetical protein
MDRGPLHLEGRYNYEDLKTASLFAGWTFSTGGSLTVDLTPMVGVAFGQTTGIVPAVEASLGYRTFDFYIESEYLVDLGEEPESFVYSWGELGYSPMDVLRCGLVAERTRVLQTPLGVERGAFLQVAPDPAVLSLYAFNPFTEYWFLVIGLEIAW